MPPAKKETPAETSTEWLEGQLQEVALRLRRLERRLDETNHQLQAFTNSLQEAEETVGALAATVTALPTLQEEAREVKNHLGRLQDRQTALQTRSEELSRQWQAELGRQRQERTAIVKRLDGLEKAMERYESHLQGVEEGVRHQEEEATACRQDQQHLERGLDELRTKADRTLEASLRLEQETTRLANQVAALQEAQGALSDGASLIQQMTRRAEERLDALDRYLPLLEQLREDQQSARFELGHFGERIATLEQTLAEAQERSAEMQHLLGVLQQRSQQEGAQLSVLLDEMRGQRQQVAEQLRRTLVILQRQRRRRLEALQQEITELSTE